MRKYIAFLALAPLAFLAGCGGSSKPSPVHQAAVYADAVTHGDFRQACTVVQTAVVKRLWTDIPGCEAFFAAAYGEQAAFTGTLGVYRVVAGSLREWREGSVRVASVRLRAPVGVLVARLVETRAGWRIAALGPA